MVSGFYAGDSKLRALVASRTVITGEALQSVLEILIGSLAGDTQYVIRGRRLQLIPGCVDGIGDDGDLVGSNVEATQQFLAGVLRHAENVIGATDGAGNDPATI